MKKITLFAVGCLLMSSLFAQDSTRSEKKPVNLYGRANDHLLVQYGYAGWNGAPDSTNTGGFSNSLNIFFMFDFPFKSNPKLSIGIGAGVASDKIKFEKTFVGIKENSPTLQFRNQADTNHFKKNRLTTTYLEAPVEFRYTAKPYDSDRSFKFALGVRVGMLIDAHTRYKEYRDKNGNTINDYKMKEADKKFFNTTRLVGQARVGWGHFSLFGSYQITTLFKEGVAAEIRPYTIGLTLSGL